MAQKWIPFILQYTYTYGTYYHIYLTKEPKSIPLLTLSSLVSYLGTTAVHNGITGVHQASDKVRLY